MTFDLGELVTPLRGPDALGDHDPLIERIGDARIVLLGEATHGTHEFYRSRARITERLVRDEGFSAVAIEGDWPDAYRVNRYVRGLGDFSAEQALRGFVRFPQWMWRNAEMLEFIDTLRAHNERLPAPERVGVYGLDVYSLHASMQAVVEYLERVDPQAAIAARAHYACFDAFGDDVQSYGFSTSRGLEPSCEDQVLAVLVELRERASQYLRADGLAQADEQFSAEQNARVVESAERYYREMFGGRTSSWNLRDRHMADTLDALLAHLERGRPGAKIVVWAHNSHVGDARATRMGDQGELNIGQLARERHGRGVVTVGQTTYDGWVAAASDWGKAVQKRRIVPARPGSVEHVLHQVGCPAFVLDLAGISPLAGLSMPRLERAIGVVYRPDTELSSHYFEAVLSEQFDVVIHFDRTRAVTPLDRKADWDRSELPETYPTGV